MKSSFQVIGTGSKGNCYALYAGDEILLIEAGVISSTTKKAIDFRMTDVVGVLITHEHGDHKKIVSNLDHFGRSIFCTFGTAEKLNLSRFKKVEYLKYFEVGQFKITPFETFHDAKEPCGFLIEFDGKRLAFITDTCDLQTRLNNVDYWIIEANYSNEKLKRSTLDPRLKKRIQDTHMSIDRCKTILDAHNANFALLIHASNNHADKEEFLTKIPYAAIAENGLIIDL